MALPKIQVPIYETELPSGKKISFRPFLVKEEKILLMASQAKDEKSILPSILQILHNCVVDGTDVKSLPVFDVEYLFLQLRARSVGEMVELRYKCNNTTEDGKVCNTASEYEINLLDVKPTKDPNNNHIIDLGNQMGMTLRPPRMNLFTSYDQSKMQDINFIYDTLLIDCIESIYDKDSVYYIKDTPKEEVKQFIESLTTTHQQKINEYFTTLPKIQHTIHFSCEKCHHQEDIVVEGVNNFFL